MYKLLPHVVAIYHRQRKNKITIIKNLTQTKFQNRTHNSKENDDKPKMCLQQ